MMASELMVARNSLSSILGLGKWPATALDCCLKIYMAAMLPCSVEATQKAFEIECKSAVSCRMGHCFACYLKMLCKGRRDS